MKYLLGNFLYHLDFETAQSKETRNLHYYFKGRFKESSDIIKLCMLKHVAH